MDKIIRNLIAGISLLLIVLFLVMSVTLTAPQSAHAAPGILYAAPTAQGSGNCSSWANACTLQTALTNAVSGDEIWVKAGVHYPGAAGNRTATFTLKNGVAIYGGFAGTETSRDQRNWQTTLTILSGDIDHNDTNTDGNYIAETAADIQGSNTYHVVTGGGTDSSAVLDGFVITAGQASGSSPNNAGGGMYNDHNSPMLRHLIFSGNKAIRGGGMYNNNGNPILTDVAFYGNNAIGADGPVGADGGGYGGPGENGYGGGLYNASGTLTITSGVFENNTARGGRGGAGDASQATYCYRWWFSWICNYGHPAGNGGNGGKGYGGAIYNASGYLTVTASLFQNNRVYGGQGGNGGAGSPSYGGSDWYYSGFPGGSGGNGGLGYGGSIYNGSAAHLSLIANIFSQDGVTGGEGGNAGSNVGTGTGGGGNGGTAYGGALYNDSGNAEAINVALYASYVGGGPPGYGNPSGSYGYGYGGGIYNSGTMLVVNSTVARNYTPNSGGGGGSSNSGTLTFKNSIVAQNSPGNCLGGATSGGYNLEDGNTCGFTQPGDLSNTDPLFVAPASGNLRLQFTSPAIDAGNNAAVSTGVTTDLDGNPRFVDLPTVPNTGSGTPPIVDMGAYEAQYVDVALDKAVAPTIAAPGQAITFTLTLSNTGSLPATGIVVTDTLPVILSGLSFTSTLSVTNTGHVPPYVWTVQDLTAGQGGVITVSGMLTVPLAAGDYTNTAVITATGDLLAGNNTAVVTFTVPNVAPAFTSAPVITATQDVPYTYTAAARDDNGDTLTITAPTKPAWLTLTDHGNGTATLSGTPSNAHVGDHPVVLRVTDRAGSFTEQVFTITVAKRLRYIFLPLIFKSAP